jgi:hypothetical protein
MPSSTAYRSGGADNNDASIGSVAWQSLNAGPYCTINTGVTSNYLERTVYGFTLPARAIITGIEVYMNTDTTGTGNVFRAQLLKSNSLVGSSKSFSDGVQILGGQADLWSSSFTKAEVEASGFGVSIWAIGGTNSQFNTVYQADIKIYYTFFGQSIFGSFI